MGPRQTHGGHHLNSAIREFFETQTRAPMGSPQVESRDKRIQEASHANAEPCHFARTLSLSLRTAILNSKSLKIAVSEIRLSVPGQRERMWSDIVGRRLYRRKQSSPSWGPKRHPGFSSAAWNLAAVHRPLQAIPIALITRPTLHELTARPSQVSGRDAVGQILEQNLSGCTWPRRCRRCYHFDVSWRQLLVQPWEYLSLSLACHLHLLHHGHSALQHKGMATTFSFITGGTDKSMVSSTKRS